MKSYNCIDTHTYIKNVVDIKTNKHQVQSVKSNYTQVASIFLPGWSLQVTFVSYCLMLVIGQEITKICKECVSLDS